MSQKNCTILICSAGRRAGLVQSFRAAAERLDLALKIVACDLQPELSSACALADVTLPMPRVDDPSYGDTVLAAVREHGVSLIIPTIDPELLPLGQMAEAFAAEGARLHLSDLSVIEVARDKARTSEILAEAGVAVPRTLSLEQVKADPAQLDWPVFAKPSGGSASRGLEVFERPEDVPDTFIEPMIFQDLIEGPEYTINMFIDADGVLRCVVPHLRMRIRAGEVEKGRTERRDDLRQIAEGIVKAMPGLRGVACFQILDDPRHGPKVIEINARFGGGYPLADHAGATFAQWLLEEVNDLPRTAHDNWRDGVLMLRYDEAVYRG